MNGDEPQCIHDGCEEDGSDPEGSKIPTVRLRNTDVDDIKSRFDRVG